MKLYNAAGNFVAAIKLANITGRRIESPKRPFIQTSFMCDISFLQGRVCTKGAYL